jgi:hypothetical protein
VNVEVLQIGDDDVDGQRFIVYDEAMDIGHERGIFRVTWKWEAVLAVLS